MRDVSAIVTGSAAVTPGASSVRENCDLLCAGKSFFSEPAHFDARGNVLGVDHSLDSGRGSRAVRLLEKLRASLDFRIPGGTRLFLSTTIGAVDRIENGENTDSSAALAEAARGIFPETASVCLVSAACASGQTAASLAMEQLAAGVCSSALVIGCDAAGEFVHSGFSALGAVSKGICRPYDADRCGLTLGEAAAALLLAPSSHREGFGRLIRASENCDACHITAPDLEGRMLKEAILNALGGDVRIGGIIGHGTGTVYNDLAEINALNAVFGEIPPLFSLKGNFGHTLGATGVLQIVLGIELSRRRKIPPQAGLHIPMKGAEYAVSDHVRTLDFPALLSLNVGFGGLNSAVVLEAV